MKKLLLFLIGICQAQLLVSQINWFPSHNGIPAGSPLSHMALAPNGDIYITSQLSGGLVKLFKSTNKGASWTAINGGALDSTLGTGAKCTFPASIIFAGNTMLLSTHVYTGNGIPFGDQEVYASTDYGQTWALSNTGVPANYALNGFAKAGNGDIYLCGTKNANFATQPMIVKSIDNGLTWAEVITSGFPAFGNLSSISNEGGRLLVNFNGSSSSDVLASTDNGANWGYYDAGMASGDEIAAFATSLNNQLLALASPAKMYSSTNNALSWQLMSMTGCSGMTTPRALLKLNDRLLMIGSAGSSFEIYSTSQPTGISEISSALQIKVYPNPANTSLTISDETISQETIQGIEIISASGQFVKSYPASSMNLDLQDLGTGLYFVKIKSEDSIKYARFVKVD